MQVFYEPQAFLQAVGVTYSAAIQQQLRQQLTEAFDDCLQTTQQFWLLWCVHWLPKSPQSIGC